MEKIKLILAVLTGNALVITKKDNSNARVTIGKKMNKQFAVSSLASAVKAIAL